MRNFILIFIGIHLSFISFSQDKSIAKVHYNFKHINDTNQRDLSIRDEVVTYLGSSSSYYTSYSSARMSEQLASQISRPTFDGNLTLKGSGTAIKETFLLDIDKPKLDIIRNVGSASFIIQGEYPEQEWEIVDETKEIGGYSCQKAITTFKGRNYEAWFCADIPMSYGPWKLHGLPGLILEAKDDKNEVVFVYAGFDRMEGDKSLIIAISPEAKVSTEEEVLNLEKAFKANTQAFIQSQQAAHRGSTMVLSSANASAGTVYKVRSGMDSIDPSKIKSVNITKDDTYKSSNITNNPIELTK